MVNNKNATLSCSLIILKAYNNNVILIRIFFLKLESVKKLDKLVKLEESDGFETSSYSLSEQNFKTFKVEEVDESDIIKQSILPPAPKKITPKKRKPSILQRRVKKPAGPKKPAPIQPKLTPIQPPVQPTSLPISSPVSVLFFNLNLL